MSTNSMKITSLFSFALSLMFFTPTSPTTLFNLTTDQSALLSFKKSLTLALLLNNWSTNTPTCSWVGVSCGLKHRRITALNVSGHELHGPISPHLGNLTFLRSLDISSNELTGEIPPSFGALSRLQYINLGGNNLSGSIPNALFNLSSLEEIYMKNSNQLSGKLPEDICSNTDPKLRIIDLGANRFSGEIPASIYKCRAMEKLWLDENHFNGNIPGGIGSLSKLKSLSLSYNEFTGSIPSSIFNLSNLVGLYLDFNNLSGSIPTDIPYNLPRIEHIYLSTNSFTGTIPKQFGNLTSLTRLKSNNNMLTGELPEELGNLTNLGYFSTAYNNLSGHIPSSIFNISTLTDLWLQQNLLSGSIPSNMGLSILSLQNLVLHYNRLTGGIPTAITNASNLIILELNRNFLTGPIPSFGNLRYLTTLRLWENRLTGAKSPTQELEFVADLTKCRYLKFLEISTNPLNGVLPNSIGNFSDTLVKFLAASCEINGAIPSEIEKLINLQSLHLHENKLTGIIPTSIGKLKQLQELYIGGNRLEGYIPRELCKLSKLGNLDLSFNAFIGPIDECFGELADSLREISFSSNKLNSTLPSKFWDLSDLVILDLSSNNLSGQISPRIGNWRINQLDLSFNQFTGEITSSIGDCLSLETLDLSSNRFGGSIPESLGKLKGLKTFNLSDNDLSGSIPDAFADLKFLEQFDVSRNKLEGDIPNGIVGSTAQSFAHNSALCGAAEFQVPPCGHGRSRSKTNAMVFLRYVLPPFILAAVVVVVVVVTLKRRRNKVVAPPESSISLEKIARRRISYLELERGTESFSELNLLGSGSFGSVFKATLSDGLHLAVKVFNLELGGASKSFDTESGILSSIRHRNLVSVISCCCNNADFRALILEYMPNGSLEKWLHSDSHVLDLLQRLSIVIDVALALEYLHHDHTFPVVHCDIKPSNVLLDNDMIARVADFGISKLFDQGETMSQTTTLATIGYAAPEYGSEGKISTKGDVYSYGILLLEMFTGKKPTSEMFNEEMSLKDWANEALQENEISEMVATGLLSREDRHFSTKEQCVASIFDLAMKCLASSPEERINMREVVSVLHKIKAKVTATRTQTRTRIR